MDVEGKFLRKTTGVCATLGNFGDLDDVATDSGDPNTINKRERSNGSLRSGSVIESVLLSSRFGIGLLLDSVEAG
jgi:hypothetical protein